MAAITNNYNKPNKFRAILSIIKDGQETTQGIDGTLDPSEIDSFMINLFREISDPNEQWTKRNHTEFIKAKVIRVEQPNRVVYVKLEGFYDFEKYERNRKQL